MSAEITVDDSNGQPMADIAIAVRAILAQYLGRSVDEIRLDSRLEHDLELDSFSTIEITVALETAMRFSMEGEADPYDLGLVTVGDLVTYVSGRLAAQRRPGETSNVWPNNR